MAWKYVQRDENGKYRTTDQGGGGGSSTFAGLDDVSFSNLQNGQVPKYNSQTQKWENADESGGGGTVTDVKVDGQSVVDPQTGEANITMPTPPSVPVQDVEVDDVSVVDGQGTAKITIPIKNVKVNGQSVVSNNEALIKSYKEVTQAQYNALPDSKLTDGILYAIKDSGGADAYPPIIYSDAERVVGVWRDGKPLYEKTIYYDNANGISDTSQHDYEIDTIPNICLVNSSGYIFNPSTGNSYTLPYSVGSKGIMVVYKNSEKAYIRTIGDTWSNTWKFYITIQYTKTTDTAGSGQWSTEGTPTHHYSTTEQVIGTWIDDKPLYEKVLSLNSTQISNNNYSDSDIGYADHLDIISGYYLISGAYGNLYIPLNSYETASNYTRTGFRVYNKTLFTTVIGYTVVSAVLLVQYTKTTDV